MRAIGLIQLALLSVAVFTVLSAIVIALVYRHLRPRLAHVDPAQRSRLLAVLCMLPAIAAGGLTLLSLLPKAAGAAWPSLDHCADHSVGHPHLCMVHLPHFSGSVLSWSLTGALGAYLFACVVRHLTRLSRQRRALRQLERTANPDPTRGVWVVETDAPFAWTTGIWRQRTLLSRGLLGSLPEEHISVVIEHERAHERRHDVLLRMGAALLSYAHFPRVRHQMLTDLELATEQACDEEAGARMGDRFLVAQALLGLERLLQDSRGLAGAFIGGSSVVLRVESLLSAPSPNVFHRKAERRLAIGAMGAMLLLANPLHHLTETILGLFAR